jgi:sterol desaturase/sphingolipid hydroxylase (fatty acid hydroxylase superfamily)
MILDRGLTPILIQHEAGVRIACFLVFFAFIALAEWRSPRRHPIVRPSVRWFANVSVHVVNGILPRLLFPLLPVGMAVLWAEKGWGLLNAVALPEAAAVVLSLLILDFVVYAQHFLFHHVPFFWRLHRMHHTDLDLDLTSALRFHPLEILVSLAIKLAVVALLGPPALAVLIFEVLLNAMAMFNHGNFRIPARLDGLLRRFVVTPDMHLVHHSTLRQENNRNFGFNLSLWDRLCGTYLAEPSAGRAGMVIGLADFQDLRYTRFWKMILNPLEKG